MTSNPNEGKQFICEDCGKPKYNDDGSWHSHIKLSQEDRDFYRGLSEHFARQRELADIERHREVNLDNKTDLLDHLKSENGHGMDDYLSQHPRTGAYAMPEMVRNYGQNWASMRSAYHPHYGFGMDDMPTRIPGVRDLGDRDFELTHEELKNVHTQLHNLYPDDAHVTEGSYHRHL